MIAYCANNPVNGCDPCGHCFHRLDFWNDCEDCGGLTIGDKWDEYIENSVTLTGTMGMFASGTVGMYDFTGSLEIAADLKGNIQIVGTGSFDITSSGSMAATGGFTGSLYVMPDTSYLAGDTYYLGGGLYVPNPTLLSSVGVSGNVGQTSDGYWGASGSLGVGTITAIGVDFHAGYSRTVALTKKYNIFEMLFDIVCGW